MKPLFTGLLLALTLTLYATMATAAERNPDTLKVALLPDENVSLLIQRNKPLADYLEGRLGKRIELVVTTDYSSMIEAMRFGRIDIAYFGPVSYVLAKSRSEIEPFAGLVVNGRSSYRAVIIGNVAQGINQLDDIRGKDVAYGDQASTSSHLMPRAELLEQGLEAGKDYRAHYTGAHDAVVTAVHNGHAVAGGMGEHIWQYMLDSGRVDQSRVQVIAYTPYYPQYPWAMQTDLAPELREAIRSAFLNLDDAEILGNFKAEGFSAVTDEDYDVYRQMGRILGINLADI